MTVGVRHAILVPDRILVVVVPAGIDAVVEHLVLKIVLPPMTVAVAREVEVRAPAVPELVEADGTALVRMKPPAAAILAKAG